MKNIESILLVIVLCFSLSCNNSINVNFVDESKVEIQHVSMDKIHMPKLGLVPKGCCFVDSLFAIYNSQVSDSIISIYKGNKLIFSFGKTGNGNDEMQMPLFVGKGRCLKRYLPIRTGLDYRMYDLQQIDFENGTVEYKTEEMPEEAMLANYVLYNDDSLMVLNVTGDYQLLFYDKIFNNKKNVSFIDDKFMGGNVFDMIYNTSVFGASYNCNGNYIVIAYYRFKMIDIVSMSGKLIKRLTFDQFDINKSKFHPVGDGNVRFDDSIVRFFTSIIVDDDYFYVVCQNDTKVMNEQHQTKTKLYKLDYNGTLQKVYQLDRKATFGVVKENELYIIGYSNTEDAEVYHAKL